MEHVQYLPNYKKDFEQAEWLYCESSHYIFRYFTDSLAEKDIEKIIIRQENTFKKILSFLNLPAPREKIKYYLYPNREIKRNLMGDDWYAQAIYNDFIIHALYSETDKVIGEHEDTHLLSLPWGLSVGFIQEGLAEYMVGHSWRGESLDQKSREGLKNKIPIFVTSMMFHQVWLNTPDDIAVYYYAYAGSFVSFLVNQFGKEKFEELYKNTNRKFSAKKNTNVFNSIYNKPLEDIEDNWKRYITIVPE